MSRKSSYSPANPDIERRWSLLRAKIERAAEFLPRQGSLASRLASGRRVWSLRFKERSTGGATVQRSIYIGDNPELVERARQLVDRLRRGADEAREVKQLGGLSRAIGAAIRACLNSSGSLQRPRRRRRQWSKDLSF